MNRTLDPPAIVREVQDDLPALAAQANAAHEAGEEASQKGLEYFRAAGVALLRAKQQCGHGKWLPWLKANVTFGERQAQRCMELAKSDVTSDLESQWRVILGNDDGEDSEEKKTAHVAHNSGEPEWYTPPEYLDAARAVLGAIDLDPASSEIAQKSVQADAYFTKDDDGLAQPWQGRVWMNPPYTSGLVDKFVAKLAEHHEADEVPAAVCLVNNATDTQWFRQAASVASAICFPTGRVRFLDPEGNPGAPLQGQAVLYLGKDVKKFLCAFADFGFCVEVRR